MASIDATSAPEGRLAREEYEEKVRFFSNFLNSNRDEWQNKISQEVANNRYRIPLELSKLQDAQPGLARRILEQPVKYLEPWEEALLNFMEDIDVSTVKTLKQPLRLSLTGAFGRNHITPRGLTSNCLGRLVCIEGVVTKCGISTPKLLQSIHVRKGVDDGHVESKDHRDATAFVNQPMAGAMPKADAEGNELEIEIGLSVYKDSQKFTVQEAPESLPRGQIPRNVEVICEGDLADKAKPGDRVQVTGVYKSFPTPLQDTTNGVWPSKLIASSITPVKELLEAPFVLDDVKNIKMIGAREDTFELLARSFAPSICGHEKVKAGLLLQMIGGAEKNLANGTHLRGDINILLIGDPSCGKSQMLRFVMNTAPLAISTTGRGSSGVGLTAAMIRDPGSRDFHLEAGAMVLADRGVICIDEFDKMGLNDRVSIHEAMEQQCVTIAKAGMHVTLNARCSVTAAANPIYGTFDPTKDLSTNIGMPDSLLSRFDLVYIVRDNTTEAIDRRIASQVLKQACFRGGDGRRFGVEQMHSSILERHQEGPQQQQQEASEVFQKAAVSADSEEVPEVVTVDFLRKYLRFCKKFTPVLSEEAAAEISDRYVDLRLRFQSGLSDPTDTEGRKTPKLQVTTRTLEALIRLATAHAKLKLRKDFVLKEDVSQAFKLMLQSREEDVPEDVPQPAPVSGDDGTDGAAPGTSARGQKRGRDGDDLEATKSITRVRLQALTTLVARTFARQDRQDMMKQELFESVNASLSQGESPFSEEEFAAGMHHLQELNKILVDESDNVLNIS